jgi:hypothetical protein
MYWVVKDTSTWATENGTVYRTATGWKNHRRLALRFGSAEGARRFIKSNDLYGWVKAFRVTPKTDADIRGFSEREETHEAHESGRVAERKRWAAEFRSRARTLRQWAEEARSKGQGVVARTNDICAAQLDVIADAMAANDPSAVELP